MPKYFKKFFINVLTLSTTSGLASEYKTTAEQDPCGPNVVGKILESTLNMPWNKGHVRAGEAHGELWTRPVESLKLTEKITRLLREQMESQCSVQLSDVGGITIQISPLNSSQTLPKDLAPSQVLRKGGTTIGALSPTKGEYILLMYSTKIATAIAQQRNKSLNSPANQRWPSTVETFPMELDIEYNFGKISIQILSGTAKTSMKDASQAVFTDLRKLGYKPMSHAEAAVAKFDALWSPEQHESEWFKDTGIARVELSKLKRGLVRMNLYETRQ